MDISTHVSNSPPCIAGLALPQPALIILRALGDLDKPDDPDNANNPNKVDSLVLLPPFHRHLCRAVLNARV